MKKVKGTNSIPYFMCLWWLIDICLILLKGLLSILDNLIMTPLALQQAAGKLWALVKSEGKIMSHLAALRDYFFMGRGDFWQNFLLEVPFPMTEELVHLLYFRNLKFEYRQGA